MLAKMNAKNQITLPRSVFTQVPATEYYDVEVAMGCIVLIPLTPLVLKKADSVRAELAQLGIDANDVKHAMHWARRQR